MKLRALVEVLGFLVFTLGIGACSSQSHTGKNTLEVTIAVSNTSSYCGGVEPPEELLKALAVPQPLQGEKVFIKKGDVNHDKAAVLKQGITSTTGEVTFNLKPGMYFLVFENKVDRSTYDEYIATYGTGSDYYDPIDRACLDKWVETPELIFAVQKNQSNDFSLTLHKNCPWNSVPCTGFIGSPPP